MARSANRETSLHSEKGASSIVALCRWLKWVTSSCSRMPARMAFVMSSNYNSKTRAAEVLIEDGKAKLVRKRESFDDLVRGEIIPD